MELLVFGSGSGMAQQVMGQQYSQQANGNLSQSTKGCEGDFEFQDETVFLTETSRQIFHLGKIFSANNIIISLGMCWQLTLLTMWFLHGLCSVILKLLKSAQEISGFASCTA